MNRTLPCQPVEGISEVDYALVFYGEGGSFPGTADQSPKVDDRGGADDEFGVYCIHRKLNWDAGNDFTFWEIGLNNLEKEEGKMLVSDTAIEFPFQKCLLACFHD